MGGLASGQIGQSLGFVFESDEFENFVALRHGVYDVKLGQVDVEFEQLLQYDIEASALDGYAAGLEFTDNENLFATIMGTLGETRSIEVYYDNRLEREGYSVGLNVNGQVEWSPSTFGIEGLDDPNFDFLAFTDEELDAFVWARSHFLDSRFDVEINPLALGRLQVRPKAEFHLGHTSFDDLSFNSAAAVGFAILPLDAKKPGPVLEQSNLSISNAGSVFSAGKGELVLSVGHDDAGVTRLAALVFNAWELGERVILNVDALASWAPTAEQHFNFDSRRFRVGIEAIPNENWLLEASAATDYYANLQSQNSIEASAQYFGVENFSPYASFSAMFLGEEKILSFPIGFEGTIDNQLNYALEVEPVYSSLEQKTEVLSTASIFLNAPPAVDGGQLSEFEVFGTWNFSTGEKTIGLNGTAHF